MHANDGWLPTPVSTPGDLPLLFSALAPSRVHSRSGLTLVLSVRLIPFYSLRSPLLSLPPGRQDHLLPGAQRARLLPLPSRPRRAALPPHRQQVRPLRRCAAHPPLELVGRLPIHLGRRGGVEEGAGGVPRLPAVHIRGLPRARE